MAARLRETNSGSSFHCVPPTNAPCSADPAVPLRHALLHVGLRAQLPPAAGALHHAVPRPPVGQVRPPQQTLLLHEARLGQLPEGHLGRQGGNSFKYIWVFALLCKCSRRFQELIPEFFCLPEMFTNMNGYKVGQNVCTVVRAGLVKRGLSYLQ